MRLRLVRIAALLAALALLTTAPTAHAEFGLHDLEVAFVNEDGSPAMQAGSHPFAMNTSFSLNGIEGPKGWDRIDGALEDLVILQDAGFVGNPTAVPRCSTLDFLNRDPEARSACPDSAALGLITVTLGNGEVAEPQAIGPFPIYNLLPSPGAAAKLGFWVGEVPVTIDLGLDPTPPYKVYAASLNTSQTLEVFDSSVTLWGNPADAAHDWLRGRCLKAGLGGPSVGECPANVPVEPLITLPRRCEGPLLTVFEASSWWSGDPAAPGPSTSFSGVAATHDSLGEPLGTSGCSKLGFDPRIEAEPTTKAASSPSGLDFSLRIDDEGLTNPAGLAQAEIEKAVVTLPEGMTTNPSIAEGLEACTPAELARESAGSAPGEGCPKASKVGTVEVQTPLLEESVGGSLFIAQQDDPATSAPGAENPFDSILALYVVIKNANLGIVVKQPLNVVPDSVTGRLTTVAEDLPQLPFSSFRLHFREGARSPLVSPPACGTHTVRATLTPRSGAAPLTTSSSFEILTGPDAGPCPSGGLPPFDPGLFAGTLDNRAGAHSPFHLRLFRSDSEQELTRFSIELPPGLVGKLAGLSRCSEAAIAAAKLRSGREEEASPSCPAASQIGRTLVGAGVGPSPVYAPGAIYLAGPYNGAPLSVVAITSTHVGPFDLGTVVVREALRIDPATAEVFVDPSGSDPIPHIVDGIAVHAKDIRVYADRPGFVLNPTSCERTAIASTAHGSGLDFGSAADDNPVSISTPFQAVECASLGFAPRLSLALKGGTKRGGHPALTGTFRPRPGDANLKRLVLRLPRSAFLDQAHIRTICTRVQFAADACPTGAIYGKATAWTPLLDEPLAGPVYLRSSTNKLPDFVADLHGLVDVEAVARIDSKGGGIRATFPLVPDAPLTKVVVRMQGAKKGLIVNSRDLCAAPSRAELRMAGHNGRRVNARPSVKARCDTGKRSSR